MKQIIRQAAPHVMATEPRRRSERIRAQSSSIEDEARLSQVRAAITKNASFFSDTHDDVDSIRVRQPTEVPEFTIGTLRRAIPAHCFERRCVFEPPLLSPPLPSSPLLSPPLTRALRSLAKLASFLCIPRRRPPPGRLAVRVQLEDRRPCASGDTCFPGVAGVACESCDVDSLLVFPGCRGDWYVDDSTPISFVPSCWLTSTPCSLASLLQTQECGSSRTNVGIRPSPNTRLSMTASVWYCTLCCWCRTTAGSSRMRGITQIQVPWQKTRCLCQRSGRKRMGLIVLLSNLVLCAW